MAGVSLLSKRSCAMESVPPVLEDVFAALENGV